MKDRGACNYGTGPIKPNKKFTPPGRQTEYKSKGPLQPPKKRDLCYYGEEEPETDPDTPINETVNLKDFDWIIVNSSGGKDSQAMSGYILERAKDEKVLDRVVFVHCDLKRAEWKAGSGKYEGRRSPAGLVRLHARGCRVEIVTRPQGDLLDQVKERGKWPSSSARFCTSDHKRGQVHKVFTRLTTESNLPKGESVKILNCMGLRSQESTARAKKNPLSIDKRASNGKRTVTDWLPIFDWTEEKVWQEIKLGGIEYHWAYDLGMPRLSCAFCIFAPEHALMIAGEHNRELLEEYVQLEAEIGHDFKNKFKIATIKEKLDRGERADVSKIVNWTM